jgi:AcrR family transcriptional regulator
MNSSDGAKAQGRGRPPKNTDRDVIQDLIKATELALTAKTPKEITVHEIAVAAGVNDAMIHYYFGGKDGLMVAIFDEIMRDAPYKYSEEIIEECISLKSIRPLIARLSKFYASRQALIRMTAIELISNSSKLEEAYRNRYFDVTPKFVEKLFSSMIDSGIYHKEFDVKFMTSALFSMIVGPMLLLSSTKVLDISDQIYSPEWVDDISRLLDRALRVSS